MTVTWMNPAGTGGNKLRVAVVGSGISGASAAWALRGTADVTLFEAAQRPGGHTATVNVDYDGATIPVDTGFIVYNEPNYPELTALFSHLGVATRESAMSFSLSLDGGRMEWCGEGLNALFARRRNALSPSFLWMLREVLRFNRRCLADRADGLLAGLTIGEYLRRHRFSAAFRDNYLVPMAAAIWSTPSAQILDFPADAFVAFFENHRLVHRDRPSWRTVAGGSRSYLEKLLAPLGDRVRLGATVTGVARDADGATVRTDDAAPERFDAVILACHSDQTLRLIDEPSQLEASILAAVPYRPNRVVLHRDARLMPRRKPAWAAWNYLRSTREDDATEVSVTYWMNRLQGIDPAHPLFVTLNPTREPRADAVFGEWTFDHPQYDSRALSAQGRLDEIQGLRHTWFCGAWTGYGFHEDGLRSGLDAAEALGARIPWRTQTGRQTARDALAVAAE